MGRDNKKSPESKCTKTKPAKPAPSSKPMYEKKRKGKSSSSDSSSGTSSGDSEEPVNLRGPIPKWHPKQHTCGDKDCRKKMGSQASMLTCIESHEFPCEGFHESVMLYLEWERCVSCQREAESLCQGQLALQRLEAEMVKEKSEGGRKSAIRKLQEVIANDRAAQQLKRLKTEAGKREREMGYVYYMRGHSAFQSTEDAIWARYWKKVQAAQRLEDVPPEPKEARPRLAKHSNNSEGSSRKKILFQEALVYIRQKELKETQDVPDRYYFLWRIRDTDGLLERMAGLPEVIWIVAERFLSEN